jgi:hypothetical protein
MPISILAGAKNLKLSQAMESAENVGWMPLRDTAVLSTDLVSGPWDNPTATGMILHVKVGTLTATPTYAVSLLGYDIDENTYVIWTAAAVISAAGSYFYWLGPGASTIGGFAEGVGTPVPREYAVFIDYTGTPANDYADVTVNVQLLR